MLKLFNRQPSAMEKEERQFKQAILQELLRQYRYRSYLALAITAASAGVLIFGIIQEVPEATLAAGGSALASLRIVQLAEESEEELRQYLEQ